MDKIFSAKRDHVSVGTAKMIDFRSLPHPIQISKDLLRTAYISNKLAALLLQSYLPPGSVGVRGCALTGKWLAG